MDPRALLLILLALPLAGQTSQRRIRPGRPGPQRLEVDAALLGAAAPGLADLRLRDGAGRDLPYVLVPPPRAGAPWLRARLLPVPAGEDRSGVELDLGRPARVCRMRLEGLPAPFLKRYQLEGSGDRAHWTVLVADGTLFDLPADNLRLLEVGFPEGEYRYLRVLWDDHASARPPLPAAAWAAPADLTPEPAFADLAVRRLPSEPGESRFAVALPGPHLPVQALELKVAGQGPLAREVEVTEARLAGGGLAPRVLGTGQLRRPRLETGGAGDLRVAIGAPEGAELELRVRDGDNPPLDLQGVRLELEPQPWIYFETAAEGPVTAVCLGPGTPAPRYDLEAQRGRLAVPVRAAWEQAPVAAPAPVPEVALEATAGAALDASGFRFRRQLAAGPRGLAALALDAHVLASSPSLNDLRLLDAQGRQIPYLLENRPEPLSLDLAWPRGATRERTTRYPLRLPEAGLPASRLVLTTSERVFRRRIVVTAGEASGPRAEAEWSHADPATPAPALVLPLPALEGAALEVAVAEGDNQPLAIASARLLLPCRRLRFFRPEGPFQLCYGRDLPAPDYDLALLAGRLRAAPAAEVALPAGPVAAGPGKGLERGFWVVLAGVVVGLLVLLARLLNEHPKDAVAD